MYASYEIVRKKLAEDYKYGNNLIYNENFISIKNYYYYYHIYNVYIYYIYLQNIYIIYIYNICIIYIYNVIGDSTIVASVAGFISGIQT